MIALAGSAEKAHFCAQLGADVAVDTSATDFVDAALEATGGRGVDVAFDTIGGEITTRTFRCMAFGGRHVLAGFASGIEAEDEGMVPRPILFGNFSLVGVCLAYVDDPLAVKAAVGSNFLSRADALALHDQVLDLVASGAVQPLVGLDVPFDELPDRARRHGAAPHRRPHRRPRALSGPGHSDHPDSLPLHDRRATTTGR